MGSWSAYISIVAVPVFLALAGVFVSMVTGLLGGRNDAQMRELDDRDAPLANGELE